jgi:integrase
VTDLNTGSYVVPGRITLAEWIRGSWLPMTEPRVKPSTFHSYRRNLEIHVLPTLGAKPLQQLTPPMLNALYGQLAKDSADRKALSAKTISYIHSTLHKVLADAVDAGLLGKNVAAGAKPPRPARRATGGINAWEPDELAAFLNDVRGTRLEAIWRLSAMTGMRRGEVLGLRWCDLDLDRARLAVRQALVAVGYEVVHSTPKSHSARVIDLDAETVDQLRAHRARQAAERADWGADYENQDLVVAKENGEPIPPAHVQPGLRAADREGGAPHDPATRPPPHARDAGPQGRRSRQGDQRTSRARIAGIHAQAVRPRHPRNAGRGGRSGGEPRRRRPPACLTNV